MAPGKPWRVVANTQNPTASIVASDPDSRVLSRDTILSPWLALVTVVRTWDGRLEALETVARQVCRYRARPSYAHPPPSRSFVAFHMTPSSIFTFCIGPFDEECPPRLVHGCTASTGSFARAKLLPPVPSSRHLLHYCRRHAIDGPSRASCS